MVKYPQDERSKSILLLLDSKRKEESLCDVKLILGEGITVYAHKALLGAVSPYFESMFTSTFREAASSVVDLSFTTNRANILMSVIDSFYGKSFEIDVTNVCDVMNLAAMFLLDDLKQVCEDVMQTVISLNSCVELFVTAINFELKTLMEKLVPIIKARFHDYFIFMDDMCELPVEHMKIFLSHVDTEIVTDKYLFLDLLLNWFSFDMNNERAQFLADTLDNLSIKCTCAMYEKLHHKVLNIVAQLKSEADEDDVNINSEAQSRLQSLLESMKPGDFDVYMEKKKQKMSVPQLQPMPEHLHPLLSQRELPCEHSGRHDGMEKGDDVQIRLPERVLEIDIGLQENDDNENKRAMANLKINTDTTEVVTKGTEDNAGDIRAMKRVSLNDSKVCSSKSSTLERETVSSQPQTSNDNDEIKVSSPVSSQPHSSKDNDETRDSNIVFTQPHTSKGSDEIKVSSTVSSQPHTSKDSDETRVSNTVFSQPHSRKDSDETRVSILPPNVEVNSVDMDKSEVKGKVRMKKNKGRGFTTRNTFKADTLLGTEEGAVIVFAPSGHYDKSSLYHGEGIWYSPTVRIEKEGTLQISCYIPGRKLWMDMGSIDLKNMPQKAKTSSHMHFFGAWGEMPDVDDAVDEYEMMMMMPNLPRQLQRRMLEMFPWNMPPSMIQKIMEEFHGEGEMPSHEQMRRMRDHLIRSRMHHRPPLYNSHVPNPLNPDQVNKWRFIYFHRKIFLFHQDFCESIFCHDLESKKWSTSSINIRCEHHSHDFEVADGIEPVVHGRQLYAVVRIVAYVNLNSYHMGHDKEEEQRVKTSYKIFRYKGEQRWNFFKETQTCHTTVPNVEMKTPEDFMLLSKESGFFKTIIHNQDKHSFVIFQFRTESSKQRTVHALNNADIVYIDRKHTSSCNVPSHFSYIRLPTLVLQQPQSQKDKLLCFMDDEFQTKLLYDCRNKRHENDKFIRMSDSEHEKSSPILETLRYYPNCNKLMISDGECFWLLSGETNDVSRLQQGYVQINREQKKGEAIFKDHPPPPFKVFMMAAAAMVDTNYLDSLQTARYFHA